MAHRRGHHRPASRRRVPGPERVLETGTVHELLGSGTLVICSGTGGVPVTADSDTGALTGTEAVIDKDLTAALFAEDLKADSTRRREVRSPQWRARLVEWEAGARPHFSSALHALSCQSSQ
ncbi:hypothetical protein GCM10011579_065170 [Streptomyces albiflavescens]|uniref:Uncharacterized protein n=1 Tax=Streptomyces albiflavescens TaxID=1623582 RepID=A0A917YA65_9ACTN|nr:hypothetical protein GCM10011579_065170 [Streptomyces albiflavescens]